MKEINTSFFFLLDNELISYDCDFINDVIELNMFLSLSGLPFFLTFLGKQKLVCEAQRVFRKVRLLGQLLLLIFLLVIDSLLLDDWTNTVMVPTQY